MVENVPFRAESRPEHHLCGFHGDVFQTELWKEPPDPFLEAIAKFVTADSPDWAGTATDLLEKTGADIPVNSITKRLNINASRLYNEHSIVYKSSRTHDGRRIELHYIPRDSS